MTKRFGRPVPTFESKTSRGVVREINLPREGHMLEGLYAASAAQSDMKTAPYEAVSKATFKRAMFNWIALAAFWLLFAWAFSNGT